MPSISAALAPKPLPPRSTVGTKDRSRTLQRLVDKVDLNARPQGWGALGQGLIHGLARVSARPWVKLADIDAARPQLDAAGLKVVDPAVRYPASYLRHFHGTQNLTWDAAAHQLVGMQLLGQHEVALQQAVNFVQHTFPDVCAEPRLIVDVGCGTGNSSRIWARTFEGAIVRGVDLSPTMLAWAGTLEQPEDERIQWRHGNGEQLPCSPNGADIIAMSFYAHEQPTEAMRSAIQQAYACLRPGGVLVVLDNGQAYPQPWMKNLPTWLKSWASNTLLFEPYGADFIDTDFAALLGGAGFSEVQRDIANPAQLLIAARRPASCDG